MASTRVPHQRGRSRLLDAVVCVGAILAMSACALGSDSRANAAPAAEAVNDPTPAGMEPAPGTGEEPGVDDAFAVDSVVEAAALPSLRALPPTRRAVTTPAAAARPAAGKNPSEWQAGATLQRGARGPMVIALQRRLTELGYDPGEHDGSLGTKTRQALWAFQHINNMPASGDVDAATSSRLSTPLAPVPFAALSGPTRVEVDIARQVAVVYQGSAVRLITHVSSGSGKKWCEMDRTRLRCASGGTPRGTFRVHNEIKGWRTSYLGQLYQPAYFRGGYALHGSLSVPNYPASHGCVRIPMHVAEYLIDLTKVGMPVIVR